MWTELYRPRSFDEIIGNRDVIESIQKTITSENFPHFLFYGHAGTGKTTTAKVIIHTLNCDNIELNASDERGIAVVQGKIKEYCKSTSLKSSFKIILLDEVDSMTKDAQHALRRIMELYSAQNRFILTCNNIEKVIEPLQSRCAKFQFQPITFEDMRDRIMQILKAEGCRISEDALLALYERSHGDMRSILNTLQSLAHIGEIELRHIKNIEDKNYLKVLKLIKDKRYTDACKLVKADDVIPLFYATQRLDIRGSQKAAIAEAVAEWDYRRQMAVNENIQLYALVGTLIRILGE